MLTLINAHLSMSAPGSKEPTPTIHELAEERLSIPVYQHCDLEFERFKAELPFNTSHFGERDSSVDRKSLFCSKLEAVNAHNTEALAGAHTWTAKIHEFSDWTADELKRFLGVPVPDEEVEVNEELYETPDEYTVGATSDFRSRMPAIKQQKCGDCWAFSTIDVIDFFGGSHSEQQLVDCVSGSSCNGGFPSDALKYLAASAEGSDSEGQYQYKGKNGKCAPKKGGKKVSGVKSVGRSASAIASAAAKQVVSTCIWFKPGETPIGAKMSFMDYGGGVFSDGCHNGAGTTQGAGHAIAVVGVTSDYYIIRNSWGKSWGESGYMRMKRGADICNMESGKAGGPWVAQAK
jgi:hypothetical protein